jgi:serine/threonine-protein phosphatase 2A regulatory subunit A
MKNMDSNEIYPLAVFVEELKSSDSKVKLNSIRNLSVICSALGKEKSRTELLPFLSGKTFIKKN